MTKSSYPLVYVTGDPATCFMRQPTQAVAFPLSEECQHVCETLKQELEHHQGAGLAANQIGFSVSIVIIDVSDSEIIRKFREDFSETFYGVMINPSYTPLSDDMRSDWEACFSVPNSAGLVPRYTHISYTYQTEEGETRQGQATGFLARAIQHEVDHLRGIAFIDLISPEDAMTLEAYREMRAKKIAEYE